jgi:hypothetical protein
MGKDKNGKRNKKTGKLKDLPAKAKQAAAVKGGFIPGGSVIAQPGGSVIAQVGSLVKGE